MPSEFSNIDWRAYDPDSSFGYVIEANLSFPPHLHKLYQSLCPCPESRAVSWDMLSPASREAHLILHGDKRYIPQSRLVTTLLPKIGYVCNGRSFQTYLSIGVQVDQITRVHRFNQAPFLSPYIDLCMEKRKTATSDFAAGQYKVKKHLYVFLPFDQTKSIFFFSPLYSLLASAKFSLWKVSREYSFKVRVHLHARLICLIYTRDLFVCLGYKHHWLPTKYSARS